MRDFLTKYRVTLFKFILICLCIFGSVFLMYEGKEGWGWLIFLSICIGFPSEKNDE